MQAMKKIVSILAVSAVLGLPVPAAAQTGAGGGQPTPAAQPARQAQPPQPAPAAQTGQAVQAGQGAPVGGNKALMDEWAARRRQVRDKVLERLIEQGKIPRDGAVEFEARFRPDPKDPSKLFVAVDAVRVTPFAPGSPPGRPEHVQGAAGTQAVDLALAPMPVPRRSELVSLDIPMAAPFKETVIIREGRVEEAPAFAPAPPPPAMTGGGAGPDRNGGVWEEVQRVWKRIVGFFGP